MTEHDRLWDVYRRTEYALAMFPLEIVHRSTIRAMLPRGRAIDKGLEGRLAAVRKGSGRTKNSVSDAYSNALRSIEHTGLIRRGREFVQIIDRQGLLDSALNGVVTVPAGVLDIERACRQIEADMAAADSPRLMELRRQELLALQRDMSYSPASAEHRGTGKHRPPVPMSTL